MLIADIFDRIPRNLHAVAGLHVRTGVIFFIKYYERMGELL